MSQLLSNIVSFAFRAPSFCLLSFRFLSNGIRQKYWFHDNAIVFNNGSATQPRENAVDIRADRLEKRLVFLGALSSSKGLFDLIEIYDGFEERGYTIRLDLWGKWKSQAEKGKFLSLLGTRNIWYKGFIDSSMKYSTLSVYDLLLLPSYDEGQPMVLFESCSVGLPFVAYDVGAIGENFSEFKYSNVQKGDKIQLVEYAIRLLELNSDRSLSKDLYTFHEKNASLDRYFDNFYKWIA